VPEIKNKHHKGQTRSQTKDQNLENILSKKSKSEFQNSITQESEIKSRILENTWMQIRILNLKSPETRNCFFKARSTRDMEDQKPTSRILYKTKILKSNIRLHRRGILNLPWLTILDPLLVSPLSAI